MEWLNSVCSRCCSLYLSSDRKKIVLGCGGCYAVNFSVDMRAVDRNCGCIAISVQTVDCLKRENRFICHVPAICEDTPVTASAGGIFIPPCSGSCELMLTLVSPGSVKVNQASICVMKI